MNLLTIKLFYICKWKCFEKTKTDAKKSRRNREDKMKERKKREKRKRKEKRWWDWSSSFQFFPGDLTIP